MFHANSKSLLKTELVKKIRGVELSKIWHMPQYNCFK